MTTAPTDPALAWLDYLKPFSAGLVIAPQALRDLGLDPIPQRGTDTVEAAELIEPDEADPALPDPWAFFENILGWETRHVAGSPSGLAVPDELVVRLPEHGTTLTPTFAVRELRPKDDAPSWQLLVRIEGPGIAPDARGALGGWEATAHQRFERLLRETGVAAGLLVTDRAMRLVHAPKGETSGWLGFPIGALATVAGRPMLGGLKLVLDRARLFTDAENRRLPALLKASREAQAGVSTALAEQVLGALHELLRGLDAAAPGLVRDLARERPSHLYEGLLAVLMRLVFVLYAEDRDLLPSLTDARARELYEGSYSLRGLYAKLVEDAALNPDTMEDRRGGWGRMLALFRLIHRGHPSGFVRARGGKLFDPDEFLFLEGRAERAEASRVLPVSDRCVLSILEGLMTLKERGGARERISYRALDVEQIGSVYETVMGFAATIAKGHVLAIRAGKNNRTPVFSDLDSLLALKPKEWVKDFRENLKRAHVSASVGRGIEAARSLEDLAAALDPIVDVRGSPKGIVRAGTPILQPTEERRRTGSHYTPRTLTEPIVRHALEPVFERLGENATPEEVLDLKVCDPAMGSGAFLVEACRQIGSRLVKAWAIHSATPTLPPDEDEELHARRLVAQRCLYGVDKNPRAVDLARLSLWLATLARDHEFTFLDHALREGDSLVGLTRVQIAATHWDASKPPTLVGKLVADHLREAEAGRAAIRAKAEQERENELRRRLRNVDAKLELARLIGNGIVAAFFSADKPKKRTESLVELQKAITSHLGTARWTEAVAPVAAGLEIGPHPIQPFHWEVEFPEVFARENAGFDAIIGNPPFAGKNTVAAGSRPGYGFWLQTLHPGAHGNADLVAHFFRRAFNLLRSGGAFGLIATNTISQGDTRASGLTAILGEGGTIMRATRRLKWPGEAAVVVSVTHMVKGEWRSPILDGHQVRRISAYLVEGDLDASPARLAENNGKAFQGSIVLGSGFTFDDAAAKKGVASSIDEMENLIENNPRNRDRIFPYIGGEEVANDPKHLHRRYIIDFEDFPGARGFDIDALPHVREIDLKPWSEMDHVERQMCLSQRIVPADYNGPVASDWPDLLELVRQRVKDQRSTDKRASYRKNWWRYAERRRNLYAAIARYNSVYATNCGASPHLAFAKVPTGRIYANTLAIIAEASGAAFSVLQSRGHETWARFFSSSMKDDLRYTPSDCFRTFPFPRNFDSDIALEERGEAYQTHRAKLMVDKGEGLTKTYNRFHARGEKDKEIIKLRDLHAVMDRSVLEAYGWRDLAADAAPEFIEGEAEEGKVPKTRLDWPASFKDAVLARLLALNAERAAEERAAGLVAEDVEDDPIDEHEAA